MTPPGELVLTDLAGPELAAPAISPEMEAELARLTAVHPRRPRRQLGLVVLSGLAVVATLIFVRGARADLPELPWTWVLAMALAWMAGLVAIAWPALVPRDRTVMPHPRGAAWRVIFGAMAFVAVGLASHPAGPSSLDYGCARFTAGHGCLELGMGVALGPLVLGAWYLRGTAPIRTGWLAAALGAAAGCAGGLLLHFSCRIADGLHVGVVHGGVVAATAAASALVLPRVITMRPPNVRQ